MEELLQIKNLYVEYRTDRGTAHSVNGIDLIVKKGETLGLVGETGAGKTTTALSILQLLPDRVSYIADGQIMFEGQDLLQLRNAEMRALRGEKISMIFQDPMTALNPIMTVGDQIKEALLLHTTAAEKGDINQRVDNALEMVGIPKERKGEYPMQFSGGMKQRVVIAIALACSPELLIADEPTTALDVTIQAQVLALIKELKAKLGTSVIMITHDLGVIAQVCDNVAVMYAGEIVEYGSVQQIFDLSLSHHPYTEGLFGSIPNHRKKQRRLDAIQGLMPDPTDLPMGCKFAPRCPYRTELCGAAQEQQYCGVGHSIRCHLRKGENAL